MAMHPVLARGLDKSPPMTPVAATDRVIEGADGQPLGVRIYRNADLAADVTTPAVVWFHGGGFVMGDLETDDSLCRTIAERIGAVVVSVDYRLAPEHPFPAGVEDCYRSLCWVAGHSAELTVDPSRLAVGGTSAGGGLAAAVALMTRDRGGPRLTFQFLGFPMLDDDADTWSMRQHCDPRVWDADACRRSWALYLGPIDGPPSPYAAPARAPDLAGPCLRARPRARSAGRRGRRLRDTPAPSRCRHRGPCRPGCVARFLGVRTVVAAGATGHRPLDRGDGRGARPR